MSHPLELGEAVLRGVQRNDPYILAHGEFKDEVREIFDEILDQFPEARDVPEGRLAFERRRREITEAAKRGEPRRVSGQFSSAWTQQRPAA